MTKPTATGRYPASVDRIHDGVYWETKTTKGGRKITFDLETYALADYSVTERRIMAHYDLADDAKRLMYGNLYSADQTPAEMAIARFEIERRVAALVDDEYAKLYGRATTAVEEPEALTTEVLEKALRAITGHTRPVEKLSKDVLMGSTVWPVGMAVRRAEPMFNAFTS